MKSFVAFLLSATAASAMAVTPKAVMVSAERVRDAVVAANPGIPSSSVKALTLALGLEAFRPSVIAIQHNEYGRWIDYSTTAMTYDARGRVVRSASVLPLHAGTPDMVTEYAYGSDDALLPDTVTVTVAGTVSQTAIAYDSRVKHYPVRIASRHRVGGVWGGWAVTQDITVSRDAQGRVTAVTPRVLDDGSDIAEGIDYEALSISYGADGLPATIVSREADSDDETGRITFEDAMSLTDLGWDGCDCQILSLDMLYSGANRLTAATVSSTEVNGAITASYTDNGSYKALFTGTDEGMKVENTVERRVLDEFGSYLDTQTDKYITAGYVETESELMRYDRFGICIEKKDESTSTDPTDRPHELDSWQKSAVTYNALTGEPEMVVTESILHESGKFAPVMRVLYNGYTPTGIGTIEADAANAPGASRGIYDLQGRRLREAVRPGVYVIDGRTTLVR